LVKQELDLHRASIHAWSRAEGGLSQAAVGFFYESDSDRGQKLITVIQEETKSTEEKEEAGYRSPTWSILRPLQRTNKAKRFEGEAVMSTLPFL